ncbi:MAG TPA: cob(I)yrinic acid a,c-diamide adenosyltransferase [Aestuariivirgaceae bacterium]|nr:cob(I)yrinic acid a,c-diamide adenosyltransferase [Aestuariivirgaceae bacterium]
MVVLNRIYTRTGDKGLTALGSGKRVRKTHPRVEAYGTVDETNAVLGVARLHLADDFPELDAMLARIQNELFDLGADLCLPDTAGRKGRAPLRVAATQVERLERDIDRLNAELEPLRSFVLPGGHPAAAHLHMARTVCRRAERAILAVTEARGGRLNPALRQYVNRLSDFLFVASRWVNRTRGGDVLWEPGRSQ